MWAGISITKMFLRYYSLIYCTLVGLVLSDMHKEYTKDAYKEKTEQYESPGEDFRPISLKHLDRPFRMAKLNLLWSKAVHRLTEEKLKSIFGELKLHDKEEITWKHLKAEGKDKDGLQEAKLRDKLKDIMINYGFLDQIDDVNNEDKVYPYKALNDASDKYINKSLFKDKKIKQVMGESS